MFLMEGLGYCAGLSQLYLYSPGSGKLRNAMMFNRGASNSILEMGNEQEMLLLLEAVRKITETVNGLKQEFDSKKNRDILRASRNYSYGVCNAIQAYLKDIGIQRYVTPFIMGSFAMGLAIPDKSDIEIFFVVDEKLLKDEGRKRAIVDLLIKSWYDEFYGIPKYALKHKLDVDILPAYSIVTLSELDDAVNDIKRGCLNYKSEAIYRGLALLRARPAGSGNHKIIKHVAKILDGLFSDPRVLNGVYDYLKMPVAEYSDEGMVRKLISDAKSGVNNIIDILLLLYSNADFENAPMPYRVDMTANLDLFKNILKRFLTIELEGKAVLTDQDIEALVQAQAISLRLRAAPQFQDKVTVSAIAPDLKKISEINNRLSKVLRISVPGAWMQQLRISSTGI